MVQARSVAIQAGYTRGCKFPGSRPMDRQDEAVSTHRRIEIEKDGQAVLAFHCEIIFGGESPWARQVGFEAYCCKWLSTSQSNSLSIRHTYLHVRSPYGG